MNRCKLHSAQRSLETSVKSDLRIAALLEKFVHGEQGFARKLKNSFKLQGKFWEKFGAVQNAFFAAQRFDTIKDCLERLILNLDATISVLIDVAAVAHGDQETKKWSSWAVSLLKVPCLQPDLLTCAQSCPENMIQLGQDLSPSNIRLLALVTEYLSLMSEYVHRFDTAKVKTSEAPATDVIRTVRLVHEMKEARSVCCRCYVGASLGFGRSSSECLSFPRVDGRWSWTLATPRASFKSPRAR